MNEIDRYYDLRPGEYGPIVRITFAQCEKVNTDIDVVEHTLEIVLSRTPDLSGERLVLRFAGVSELKFSQPDWSVASFGLIELHDTKAGYYAMEEEGMLRFKFKTFESRIEGPAFN